MLNFIAFNGQFPVLVSVGGATYPSDRPDGVRRESARPRKLEEGAPRPVINELPQKSTQHTHTHPPPGTEKPTVQSRVRVVPPYITSSGVRDRVLSRTWR